MGAMCTHGQRWGVPCSVTTHEVEGVGVKVGGRVVFRVGANVIHLTFDCCCFYYFVRNSLVALLEAVCARRLVVGNCHGCAMFYTNKRGGEGEGEGGRRAGVGFVCASMCVCV